MDPMMLGLIIAVLVIALASLLWLKSRQSGGGAPVAERRRGPNLNSPAAAANIVAGRRTGGTRMRRAAPAADAAAAAGDSGDEDEGRGGGADLDAAQREELEEAGIKVPDGKIGKKKLEKLQMKADKKVAREAEERVREESKKKKQEEEEEEAKRKGKEEEEERRRKEEEQRAREEKEKREHEEYLQMKAAFEVQEEGFDEETEMDSQEDKLKQFVDYIKSTKVVLLEDLAAHFKLRTQEAIDRVTQLQEDGTLTGVIDDRGKFIYIGLSELESVAKFIRQRGRVSIAELAECSNKLINLTPETVTST